MDRRGSRCAPSSCLTAPASICSFLVTLRFFREQSPTLSWAFLFGGFLGELMNRLNKIWKSEFRKRMLHAEHCERCDRNWLIHKSIGLEQFAKFAEVAINDGVYFQVVDFADNQRLAEEGPWYEGEDSIVLSSAPRFTGKETHYESLAGSHKDFFMEESGSLVVHYTYRQGLIQVFLSPPRAQEAYVKKPDVLIWSSYNTDCLTRDYYDSLIAKFLVFGRVESSLEASTVIDRWRVRWWKYMDIRNRRNLLNTSNKFLNGWELSTAAAFIAVFSLIVAILSA